MFKPLALAVFFAIAAISVAIADTRIGDWAISRNTQDKTQCVAVRSYPDSRDKTLQYTVILSLLKEKIIIGLSAPSWTWDNGDRVWTSLLFDDEEVVKKVDWTATSPQALAAVPERTDALLSGLVTARTLSIKFNDGKVAKFDIPDAGAVMAALKGCVEGK